MKESWKPIPDTHGKFYASDMGRIASLINGKGRVKSIYVNITGHPTVRLTLQGPRRTFSKTFNVRRLIALTFVPNPEGKPEVLCKNGNKGDVSAGNLSWATRSEILHHAVAIGKKAKGEDHWCSMLETAQVIAMRQRHKSGEAIYSIAQQYNFSYGIVYSAVTGKTWKHLNPVATA